MEDKLFLYLLKQIEEKLGWGSSENWKNKYFEELSYTLSQKTKSKISVSTLKRIWGKIAYNGEIQIATRDVLAQFLDYSSWLDFVSKNKNSIENIDLLEKTFKQQKNKITNFPKLINKYTLIITVSIITIFVLIGFLMNYREKNAIKKIQFETLDTLGYVPFSANFKINLSGIKTKSVYAITGDKDIKKIIEKNTSGLLTATYFRPGPFKAILFINEKPVKQQNIYALTHGWLALFETDISRSPDKPGNYTSSRHPEYLPEDSIIVDGNLSITKKQIENRHLAIRDITLNYHYTNKFHFYNKPFILETRIRNNQPDYGDVCSRVNFVIQFSEQSFIISLVNKGCEALADIYLNNKRYSGNNYNLSKLAVDMKEWHTILVKTINNKFTVYIDNNLSFESDLQLENIGKFVGFRYKFYNFIGAVDYINMRDENGNWIYKNDFNTTAIY